MYGDAIELSYLLDPVYIGQGMDVIHRQQAEDALYDAG